MTKFDLNEQMKEVEEAFGFNESDSSFYKMKEGDNKIRILSPMMVYPQHYSQGGYRGPCLGKEEGCPGCEQQLPTNIKWLCYIYIHDSQEILPTTLPHTVAKSIRDFQNDPEWSFNEAPMPYSINIKADGAGTKEVSYTVIGSPNRSEMSSSVLEGLAKRISINDLKERLIEKKKEEIGGGVQSTSPNQRADYPTQESTGINPDDIPF